MSLSKLAKSQPEPGWLFCPSTKNSLTFADQTGRILSLEIWMEYGPVAQLGARFNRTEEVEGSNPSRSIREKAKHFSQKNKIGPIAQLGARLNGIEKAESSNLSGSTKSSRKAVFV